MSAARCPRLWEVEAARDGRLDASAQAELQRHLAQCRECEHERGQLSRLQHALCASTPTEDMVQLRRVRQRMLAAANERLLEPKPSRKRQWRTAAAGALALAALTGVWLYRANGGRALPAHPAQPEPIALRLRADHGARFEHERRGELEYVKLHEGSLHVSFDRSQHARLSVHTPDGEIEDFGTVFQVEVEGGYTTRIRVSQGAVRFRREGEPDVMLTAGQQFERAPSQSAAPVEPPAQADLAAHPAPPARATAHARPKPQPELGNSAEDRAYLEVLDLLRADRQEEARAAARRYCRNYPNGLRRRELEQLARSAQP
jgi:ferric-dicitrate binding protein FerR (iron transport regulator)